MKISVILCTLNRCQDLPRALESLAASNLPASDDWEVLVVDNNSKDRTPEVVEEFCRRFPGRFHYLLEPQQGKSHALNAGIRQARGEILAFMDDDVTVEPDWLRHLTAPLHDSEWAGSTGRILPKWSIPPPPWLPIGEWYGKAPLVIFDLGPEPGPLTELPFGTNMAFRAAVFEKYGGFRVDLGPQPDNHNPQKCEDSEFGHRLLAAGEKLKYEPSAVVYHPVPANRLQQQYFLTWWFDKARANILAFRDSAGTGWRVAGVPLHLLRRLLAGSLRWMVAVEPSRRFSRKLTVWFLAGQILECFRHFKSKAPVVVP